MPVSNSYHIVRFADGLFGLALGSRTFNEVLNGVEDSNIDSYLNAVYQAFFAGRQLPIIANDLVNQLGITEQSTSFEGVQIARTFVLESLQQKPTELHGQTIKEIFDLWAGLDQDPLYGAAASAWNYRIDQALDYSSNHLQDIVSSQLDVNDYSLLSLTAGDDQLFGTFADERLANAVQTGEADQTLQLTDEIDLGEGFDTVEIFNSQGQAYLGTPMYGVESVIYRTTKDGSDVNLTAFSDLQQFSVEGSGGAFEVSEILRDNTFLIKNSQSNLDLTLSYQDASLNALLDEVTVDLSFVEALALRFEGAAETVVLNTQGASRLQSLILDTRTEVVQLQTNLYSLEIDSLIADGARELVVSGSGDVTFDSELPSSILMIEGSSLQGDLVLDIGAGTHQLLSGSGNDRVDFQAHLGEEDRVNLGLGYDTLRFDLSAVSDPLENLLIFGVERIELDGLLNLSNTLTTLDTLSRVSGADEIIYDSVVDTAAAIDADNGRYVFGNIDVYFSDAVSITLLEEVDRNVTGTLFYDLIVDQADRLFADQGRFVNGSVDVMITDAISLTQLAIIDGFTTGALRYSQISDSSTNLAADDGQYLQGNVDVVFEDSVSLAVINEVDQLTMGSLSYSQVEDSAANLDADNGLYLRGAIDVRVTDAVTIAQLVEIDNRVSGSLEYLVIQDTANNLANDAGVYANGLIDVIFTDAVSLSTLSLIDNRIFGTVTYQTISDLAANLDADNGTYVTGLIDVVAIDSLTVAQLTEISNNVLGTITYSLRDSIVNITAANVAELNSAVNITVTDSVSVGQADFLNTLSNSGNTVYDLQDTSAQLALAQAATLNNARDILATGVSTVADATVIAAAANSGITAISGITDSIANVSSSNNAVLDLVTGIVSVTSDATAIQAEALSAFNKQVAFNLVDSAAAILGVSVLARNEAQDITVTGAVSGSQFLTLLSALNTGMTWMGSVTSTASQFQSANFDSTGDDFVTSLSLSDATTVSIAGDLLSEVTTGNIGSVNYHVEDSQANISGADLVNPVILNLASSIVSNGSNAVDLIDHSAIDNDIRIDAFAGDDEIVTGSGLNVVEGGRGVDTITSNGTDTIVLNYSNVGTEADVLMSFTPNSDVVQLSVSALENAGTSGIYYSASNFVNLANGAPVTVGSMNSLQYNATAGTGIHVTGGGELIIIAGEVFVDKATLASALESGGAEALTNVSTSINSGDAFGVIYSDGSDAYLASVRSSSGDNGAGGFDSGDLVISHLAIFSGDAAIEIGDYANFEWIA